MQVIFRGTFNTSSNHSSLPVILTKMHENVNNDWLKSWIYYFENDLALSLKEISRLHHFNSFMTFHSCESCFSKKLFWMSHFSLERFSFQRNGKKQQQLLLFLKGDTLLNPSSILMITNDREELGQGAISIQARPG